MVKDIRFDCDDISIDTVHNNNKVMVEASKVDIEDILNQLEPLEVVEAFEDKEGLLDYLDDEIIHDYLEKSGYIFNKA